MNYMAYIRRYYGVPAKRGGRVEVRQGPWIMRGVILGCIGPYLRVRPEGKKEPAKIHPTDGVCYLDF